MRRAANAIKVVTNSTQNENKNISEQNVTAKPVGSEVATDEQNKTSNATNSTKQVKKVETKTKEIVSIENC